MNVFRTKYRELNPDEQQAIAVAKDLAAKLHDCMVPLQQPVNTPSDGVPIQDGETGEIRLVKADPRMLALARTNLEQAIMWYTKAITG